MIFAGNSNVKLAKIVAKKIGISLGVSNISKFSDGEIFVEIKENVRGKNVFILQSLNSPSSENLMEIIIMADALKRASASCIIAAIPYFGYARQDRRMYLSRTAISARVIANILENSGINKVLFIDLHSEQIQGFFNIPVNNLYSSKIFINDIKKKKYKKLSIVSPDYGGIIRTRFFAKKLNCNLIIIDKFRYKINTSRVMNIIGLVKNRTCVIIDDIIDTAGTIIEVANILKEKGARNIIAYCTHAVLSGSSLEFITSSCLDKLIITDTIKLIKNIKFYKKIRQITCSDLLVESFKRLISGKSIISLFI